MPKEIIIASLNTQDRLSDPQIQQNVLDLEPDVMIFPEAVAQGSTFDAQLFRNKGYELFSTPYDDDDGRKDRHTLVMAAKPELISKSRVTRLAGRNAIILTLLDGTDVLGVHHDDRREDRRLPQAHAAIGQLAQSAIVGGDFNATYRDGFWPATLRAIGPLVRRLPATDPDPDAHGLAYKLRRPGSLGQRLAGMATGTTMQAYATAGFNDADPEHLATKQVGPLGVQIDHLIYRGTVDLVSPTEIINIEGPDHRLLRAVFSTGNK